MAAVKGVDPFSLPVIRRKLEMKVALKRLDLSLPISHQFFDHGD